MPEPAANNTTTDIHAYWTVQIRGVSKVGFNGVAFSYDRDADDIIATIDCQTHRLTHKEAEGIVPVMREALTAIAAGTPFKRSVERTTLDVSRGGKLVTFRRDGGGMIWRRDQAEIIADTLELFLTACAREHALYRTLKYRLAVDAARANVEQNERNVEQQLGYISQSEDSIARYRERLRRYEDAAPALAAALAEAEAALAAATNPPTPEEQPAAVVAAATAESAAA